MGLMNSFNKGAGFDFKPAKDSKYVKLVDLYNTYGKDKEYTIKALYVNEKSKFGAEPIIATDKFLINAPQHLLETVKAMIDSEDVIKYINDEHAGFNIYQYEGRNGVGYSVNWLDFE